MLDWQLCVTTDPLTPGQFQPVTNITDFRLKGKPAGGLWTSTWLPQRRTSDWVRWCRYTDMNDRLVGHWTLLKPAETARIYEINNHQVLQWLMQRYTRIFPPGDPHAEIAQWGLTYLDFERLAVDYDAIHLTKNGEGKTRCSIPNLEGWSCECTLWMKWCFSKQRSIINEARNRRGKPLPNGARSSS